MSTITVTTEGNDKAIFDLGEHGTLEAAVIMDEGTERIVLRHPQSGTNFVDVTATGGGIEVRDLIHDNAAIFPG